MMGKLSSRYIGISNKQSTSLSTMISLILICTLCLSATTPIANSYQDEHQVLSTRTYKLYAPNQSYQQLPPSAVVPLHPVSSQERPGPILYYNPTVPTVADPQPKIETQTAARASNNNSPNIEPASPLINPPSPNLKISHVSSSIIEQVGGNIQMTHAVSESDKSPPRDEVTVQPDAKVRPEKDFFVFLSNDDDDSIQTVTMSNLNTSFSKPKSSDKGSHVIEPTSNSSKVLSSVHPLLIYSMRYEIRCFDLYNLSSPRNSGQNSIAMAGNQYAEQQTVPQHGSNKQSRTLMGGLKNTIGLDFYYSEQESYIFWTDVIDERIYRGTIIDGTITNVNILVQGGLATAEGLAIDWIGHNIYWVESTLDHIEVSNMNGTYRKTLIAGEMESPRAIAVDPRYGLLFWTDWDKKSPRIERATMTGDNRKTLVHIKEMNGGWPNGLTLDYDTLKIYWIDANSDSIHVVDYEGNNHVSLLKNFKSLGHPFSITLFENNLYWTDWKTNSVSMANKNNGGEARELQRLAIRLFDIKVFHPSRQPRMDNQLNPCFVKNGNCSHLCLLNANHTRKCECPTLMRLSNDGETCEADENLLLIGRANEIRAVDINKPLYHLMAPISVPKVFSPRQFAYDSKSRSIFWVDSQTNEVKRAQIAGNSIETIIDVIIDAPSGLALDWISGNIYVTSANQDKTSSKIFISNLNGEYISILMDSTQGIYAPKSLAVNPILGLLFCVDENEKFEPIIFAAGMDGKNKRTIASKSNNPKLENPSNLAMDFEQSRVYWINQAASEGASIQYYDIVEDKIVTVFDESNVKQDQRINPSVLCVDGDSLIMSGRTQTDILIRASKNNLNERTVHKTPNIDQILALRVFNATSQVGTNACSLNNGDCSQLCVPTNSTHRACKCTMGYTINPLKETECIGKDLFLIFSNNQGMKGISLDPDQSNEEHYLPPIHKAFRASSIDYVHRDSLIYWVDNEEGSITRINRDTTNYRVIIQGLESEESIAIDWVAGNIYWLDPYYNIIEVARLNGSSRYVIVSGDMDKANGIVVNPIKGYIVWSDIGQVPKIEIADLDGGNRRIIVSKNLSHVDDLAIDHASDFIYWVDSTQAIIERIRSSGLDRQVVYSSDANQPYHNHLVSIAIYKNYLFIADSVQHHGSIIRCNKDNASDKKILQQSLGEGIRDIAVYADQPMPSPEDNPCAQNNGDCQDLCLFLGKRGKKRCLCSHGKLKSDGLTCEPYDTFVLYSKLSQIESLHIKDDESYNNSPYAPIVVENRSNIISLTVDYTANRVIYSEITRDQICSIFFNGTDKRILVDRQSQVEGIAFANDQLYWTSIHDNSISRLNTTSYGPTKGTCDDTGSCRHVEKIVALTPDDKPRGIAIDSCTNYVYWTNWNMNASIQRASPQTGFKIESIITTNIKVPNGIAIDQNQRKLYWCDARLDKIETCDMDGTNRMILISASPQHPFALAIWNNYVFWTDWLARGVFRADKYTGQQLTQIKKVVQRPMGIAIAEPENTVCNAYQDRCTIDNGGCEQNQVCRMRLTDEVECIPRQLVTDQRTFMTASTIRTYHDIIMNPMDRYNLTDSMNIQPIAAGSKFHGLVVEAPTQITPRISVNINESLPGTNSDEISLNSTNKSSNIPTINGFVPLSTPISVNQSEQKTASSTAKVNVLITSSTTQLPRTSSSTRPTSSNVDYGVSSSTSRPSTPSSTRASATKNTTPVTTTNNTVISSPNTSVTRQSIVSRTNSTSSTTSPTYRVDTTTPQPMTTTSVIICDPITQYKCYLSDEVVCISMDKRCDGSYDCPSREDENDCSLSTGGSYSPKRETNWHRYVTVILVILAAAIAALFLVFGTRGRRRWFIGTNGAFSHRRMFDDNGTNIEISNPMFDEDNGNLVHCAFSIDLNERTTNFSNPLYERQVLLMNDKHVTTS